MTRTANPAALIICIFALAGTVLFFPYSEGPGPSRVARIIHGFVGLPLEIVAGALHAGVVDVVLFGNATERHQFAKGVPTRFGQMNYSVDDYLASTYGWSEVQIHSLGHRLGFSKLWH